VAAPRQFGDGVPGQALLHGQSTGIGLARIERRREMVALEGRRIDRRLEVHAVVDMAQEEDQRPLVLPVAARRAEGHPGLTVAEGE